MKLEPKKNWVIGRAIIHKRPGKIINPNATKGTTRCYLLEEVSPAARSEGYQPKDIVVARSVYDMLFHGGEYHRVTFTVDEIICNVIDVGLDEFVTLDDKPLTESNGAQPSVGAS